MPPYATTSPFGQSVSPDEVVRQLRQLPSAPRVLPQLKKLLCDGNSSMHEVVSLVRIDPGIAARVLQMGNSAYYSHGTRCYTVDEAVNRVGYDQVYELVSYAVASQVLVRPLGAYGLDADDVWRRSVACALAAEVLAERQGVDCDVAYTIGLLHSVGLVAIDDWAFRYRPELNFAPGNLPLETCEAERIALGFHNGEAGAALLRHWEFPPVMSEPVRWQYLPRGTSAHLQLATLLHVAKWLRTAICTGTLDLPRPDPALLRASTLTSGQLEKLAEEVGARMLKVSSLLEAAAPERATVTFPGGDRHLDAQPVTRNFINGYA